MKVCAIAIALVCSISVSSCTIVFVARNGQVIAAGNEDESDQPDKSKHYVRFVTANKEKGTLGYVAFGYETNPFSDESAMNEAGLFYDFNALDKLDAARSGMPKGKFDTINQMLRTCQSVDQAVKFLESFDLPYMSSAQLVLGDAQGASAIVERHTTTWRRKDTDYQIGTNFRTSTTPLDLIKCDRYNLCEQILRKKRRVNIQSVTDLLKGTAAVNGSGTKTWYSIVCDLKKREVNLYLKGDFKNSTRFSLTEELKKGNRKLAMDEFAKK